jgi:hypothetical protein
MVVVRSDANLLASDDSELFGGFDERRLDAVVAFVGRRVVGPNWCLMAAASGLG